MYILKLVVSSRYTPFGNYTLRTYTFTNRFPTGKKRKDYAHRVQVDRDAELKFPKRPDISPILELKSFRGVRSDSNLSPFAFSMESNYGGKSGSVKA